MRSFSITSRTTCSLNSSEYLAAGMVSILSTQGKKNSPSPRNTTHSSSWVARYKKEHATDQDRKKASESAEIAKLKAEVRELRQENEFLKKAAAFFAKERP